MLCRDVPLVLGAARNAFPCHGLWWRGEGRREVAGAKTSHPMQALTPLSRHWEVGWRVIIYPSPASSNCTEAEGLFPSLFPCMHPHFLLFSHL